MQPDAQQDALRRLLARCTLKCVQADDGRTLAGARRQAARELRDLGIDDPMRARLVDAALGVADAITRVVALR